MKAFPVLFDTRRVCSLLLLHENGEYYASNSAFLYRKTFPGSAIIAADIYDAEFDIENKFIIVWNKYSIERNNLYLPFF